MKHLKNFENINFSYFVELRKNISGLFRKYEPKYEPKSVSSVGLKKSMELIGVHRLEYNTYQETWKYIENIIDDLYLIVYGSIGHPIMTYGYCYEIQIVNKNTIKKDGPLMRCTTHQNVYFDETTISNVCNDIKEDLILKCNVDKYNL